MLLTGQCPSPSSPFRLTCLPSGAHVRMTDLIVTLIVLVPSAWLALTVARRFDRRERSLILLSFGMHQLAALLNIVVTQYYYGYGDMLSYHDFGVVAADRMRADFLTVAPTLLQLLLRQDVVVPVPFETLTGSSASMQAASAFLMLVFVNSLYASCAFIATCAFLSKLALFKVLRAECPEVPSRHLIVASMLLPSALFWSSSLLKEPLAMIGLLTALYGWHQILLTRKWVRYSVAIFGGSTLAILVKGYAFPPFGLSIAAWHLARELRRRRGDALLSMGHAIGAAAGALVVIMITGFLLPQFAPDALTEQLAGMQTVGQAVEGGSNYSLGVSAGSATSQVALAPLGLLTALFRPSLLDVRSLPVFVSALETTAFSVAALIVLFRRGIPDALSELVRVPFLSFCSAFVVVFGTCVGLGTTNMGTLVRYRMPLIPFFAVLVVALIHRTRTVTVTRTARLIGLETDPSF